MAGDEGGGAVAEEAAAETLEFTPTWVVAVVCTVIVAISLLAERCIHYGGKYLKKKNQKPLYEALQKIKEELMLLGFISLLLTVLQNAISKICIPKHVVRHMLPCSLSDKSSQQSAESPPSSTTAHYQAAFDAFGGAARRLLSEGSSSNYCENKNKVPLLSTEALHHLHIFIFVLAIVHVTFCVLTILFGGAKIRQWKQWEDSIAKVNYDTEQILKKKVTHVHQHAFIRDHFLGFGKDSALLGWVPQLIPSFFDKNQYALYKVPPPNEIQWDPERPYLHPEDPKYLDQSKASFFKQFYASVTKSDYTTLRLGFIMTHCRGNPKFNFHKYMIRALEDDFRTVVGISWYLWIFVVIFLLLNVNGWHTYFWIAFIPFILLLAVGTKLEHVISQLAHEVAEKHIAIEGDLVVQPSDAHFWFGEPRIVLFLIHFILFQNAFEIAFFFWIWVQYGFDSCIMGQVRYIVPRLIIGVFIQVLCSYSTLPLYAIVTQMGTHFKKSIFDEHVQVGLVGWANKVKKKAALKAASNGSGQGSSNDSAAVRIQLGKFAHKESVPEEIQPAATSQEPK